MWIKFDMLVSEMLLFEIFDQVDEAARRKKTDKPTPDTPHEETKDKSIDGASGDTRDDDEKAEQKMDNLKRKKKGKNDLETEAVSITDFNCLTLTVVFYFSANLYWKLIV